MVCLPWRKVESLSSTLIVICCVGDEDQSRGRVRGGRHQPASQSPGPDRPAGPGSAWQVLLYISIIGDIKDPGLNKIIRPDCA